MAHVMGLVVSYLDTMGYDWGYNTVPTLFLFSDLISNHFDLCSKRVFITTWYVFNLSSSRSKIIRQDRES